MKWILLTLTVLALLIGATIAWWVMEKRNRAGATPLFPFYLPWDDSSETVTSFRRYLHTPAGKYGHVYVGPDGHLYVGGQRIKFLGVNICGSAAFPTRHEAEGIASRLAKFGVNIVRFHHMDAAWESFNIFQQPGTRRLNPAALDRLDYLIAKLKENGIYVNLNLLVSRRLTSADNLPVEIERVDWKDQQVLGFFDDEVKELHKEYARQLLTHRNPYTNTSYAEEPAVAFVEIVNEQGLIHSWLDGVIDRLPETFRQRLAEKWNRWLKTKYGSTEKLVQAWGGETRLGEEVLANPRFERGLTGWVVERHSTAQSSHDIIEVNGMKVLRIRVIRKGGAGWHVQFNYPQLKVAEEETYLVRFMAKADSEAWVTVCLRQAHDPWHAISQVVSIKLTPEWNTYEVVLGVTASDENARLDISNLGALETIYYFANFTMRRFQGAGLNEDESLEAGTVRILSPKDFFGRPLEARKDWSEFLWETERSYFVEMYDYLRSLGVKALIIGTIAGCSTPVIMSELDAVDTHAYWQHPIFPGTPWDPQNWYVVNEPMVNQPRENTITWLASRRVLGKPFTVTEYNHPAPNVYDAETYLILSAYAALQDWDGIYAFDYGGSPRDARRIRGYFDVDQHPAKMASLLLAHAIYLRGDVQPASKLVTLTINREVELDLLVRGKLSAWNLPGANHLGWNPVTPLIHRFALQLGEETVKKAEVEEKGPVYRSDNGHVIWDCSIKGRCVIMINSSKTVAIVGFGANRTFDFGSVVVEPGNSLLNGFSVLGLTSVDDRPLDSSNRMLFIALGYTANRNMVVRRYDTGMVVSKVQETKEGYTLEFERFNGAVTSAGSWGSSPTVVEGVKARVRIKAQGGCEVWALDNTGKRMKKVATRVEGEWTVFEIGPEYRTIWYEISKP